jgi:dipeptidyl aminopeptidase/acylaminoacyl peptidase
MTTKGKKLATDTSDSPSLMRRLLYLTGFVLVILAIVGITAYAVWNDVNAQYNAPRHEAKAVADGTSLNRFVTFDETDANVFPMAMTAAPDGGFYLSRFGDGTLYKVDSAGALTKWASAGPIGALQFAPDGSLYAIVYSEASHNAVGNVYRINADAKTEAMPALPSTTGLPLFSQLALDSAGNVYVTDPTGGQVLIYRTGAANAEILWSAANVSGKRPHVVALAYDPVENGLLVSDVDNGSIYHVALDGTSDSLLYRETGLDVRVISVDAEGNIFLLAWQGDGGTLYLLRKDGTLQKVADQFRSPTALVLRDDKAYIVNSDAPGMLKSNGLLRPRSKPPFTVDVVDVKAVLGK